MTGLSGHKSGRAYFDWNASAPLCAEAREAMLRAMDEAGNRSSVHAEGRKAKAIVERARAQVAELVDCDTSEVVFTSGATESAAMAIGSKPWRRVLTSQVEHDAVSAAIARTGAEIYHLGTDATGAIALDDVGEHVQAVNELEEDQWLLPTTSGPLYGKEPSLLQDKSGILSTMAQKHPHNPCSDRKNQRSRSCHNKSQNRLPIHPIYFGHLHSQSLLLRQEGILFSS